MAKVSRILALLAIVAMLAALPMTALAQQEPPHVVMGMAMVNGATPAAGTEVTAHAGAMEVGSAMTKAGGGFRVDVKNPSGQMVTFMVGGVKASQSLNGWMSGTVQRDFDLSATATQISRWAAHPALRALRALPVSRVLLVPLARRVPPALVAPRALLDRLAEMVRLEPPVPPVIPEPVAP